MTRALSRSVAIALIVLACFGLWELHTFQLPRDAADAAWNERVWLHVALDGGITLATFLGSALGFSVFPSGRSLPPLRLAVLGVVIAIASFVVALPAFSFGGLYGALVAVAAMAAALVQTGGRLLARRNT